MSEYTTHQDARDLDWLYLATIAGADYYEQRLVLRIDGQERQIVGRASDWPLIELRAQNAELTQLLTKSEQRSVEADCHVVELLSRLSGYQEHIAALEACLTEALPREQITAPEAETAEMAFVTAAAPSEPAAPSEIVSPDARRKCPYCRERPKLRDLQAHMERKHADQVEVAVIAEMAAPPAWACATCGSSERRSIGDPTRCKTCLRASMPAVHVAPIDLPFHCGTCGSDTHARSVSDPARCIRCVVEAVEPVANGRLVGA